MAGSSTQEPLKKCVAVLSLVCCCAVLVALIFSAVDLWAEEEDGITEDNCSGDCSITLVENLPEDLPLPLGGESHSLPLSLGFHALLDLAQHSVEVVSPVWDLTSARHAADATQGQLLFQRLLDLKVRGVKLKIASSLINSTDLRTLEDHDAEVRFVNMSAITRGELRSSFWIVDRRHVYIGSADMDWRSLSKRKELGVVLVNCSCLALDLHRIFSFYWQLQYRDYIPSIWSRKVVALYGKNEPLELQLNSSWATAYVSTSPDSFCPKGRSRDVEAIQHVIQSAQTFVYISVTDYLPLINRTYRGAITVRYWSAIDEVIREAVLIRRVRVLLLISYWKETHPLTRNFVTSLKSLCVQLIDCSLEVKFFERKELRDDIQHGLNHNKYIVTDNTVYIGNHDWVGREFAIHTGVGLMVRMEKRLKDGDVSIVERVREVFERDWGSPYAKDLKDPDGKHRQQQMLFDPKRQGLVFRGSSGTQMAHEVMEEVGQEEQRDQLTDKVMLRNPSATLEGVGQVNGQASQRVQNLNLLVGQIRTYYLCEQKEEYIQRIQALDFDTKSAIAAHIQELTHSQDSVLDLQWLEASDVDSEELKSTARNMALHLRHLLEQRDTHLEQGVHQHLAVELADSKAKIRRLRQELEEKTELMLDCRYELETMEAELKRHQHENGQLSVEARAARAYRDELDALRERAFRADKLESEVGRYREKLHSMEVYKAKVEELKEDNRVLQETKEVLEDQVSGWRAHSDKLHQLEKHCLLLNARIHDLEQEKEVDRKCIEELREENLALCLGQRRSMEESQLLGWELEQLSKTSENSQGQQSLSEEVSERTQSRLLRLEKENQRLIRTIEELQTASVNSSPQHSHYQDQDHLSQEITCRGDSKCVELEDEHSETRDFEDHQKSQLDEWENSENLKELVSDPVDVMENNNNPHSLSTALGSKGCRTRDDGVIAGLSSRSGYATRQTERLEAKCRVLDTENQHLQASLDNSGRRLQCLEAEVLELETESQSLQAALEEMRLSSRRLEQLEVEKRSLEQENAGLERDKRRLEKENRRLRQQAEIQEASLDSSSSRVASLEREMRVQGKELEALRETAEKVQGLDRENRELAKQAAIDQRTLATLREELVNEKLKTQQRSNELESLAHELEMRALNQDSPSPVDQEVPENRFKMLESELESSLKRSLQIKEEKMAALDARLQESASLNLQLRQDLKTLRLNLEAVQQREEEECVASSLSSRDTGKEVSQWQQESQSATKELLRVKDRLIDVERNNATLEAEQHALQTQLKQLGSQSDGQQAQILALQRQTASLQENSTILQTYNANLQSASLLAQNAQLQQQKSGVEGERNVARLEREELRGVHEQLLRDHERLSALHERQALEYETLMGRHRLLKNVHRSLELEHRTLQDRYNNVMQQRSRLVVLEEALKDGQEKMTVEKEQRRSATAECLRLRDDKDWMNQTYQQLQKDHRELSEDHKQQKTQLNGARLEHTRLEADFSKLREQYQQLDITSAKLTNQCELLSQLKGNLEEENRYLLSQIQSLMLQNRSLLEQTMESKDLFHVEQRQYIEKLNELRRQKEKLEEKIMDQYKFYDPSPTRRRGNWIALKMKKLIKSRSRDRGSEGSLQVTPTHSCSCEGLEESPLHGNQDSGSLAGSDGSGGSASAPAPVDGLSPQRSISEYELIVPLELDVVWPRRSSGAGKNVLEGTVIPDVSQKCLTDKDSVDSASGFEDNEDLQRGVNGSPSRGQSESSGEFSMSQDNEPWSNGSSPVLQPLSCSPRHAHPAAPDDSPVFNSDVRDPQLQCNSAAQLKEPGTTQDFWPMRATKTIRRGSKTKAASRRSSDSGSSFKLTKVLNGLSSKSSPVKAEAASPTATASTRSAACSPIAVLYVQGKSSSVSGCLNCFSAPLGREGRLRGFRCPKVLPRASSVISTADGSSRRSAINANCGAALRPAPELARGPADELADRCREQAAARQDGIEPDPTPPLEPPRDPALTGGAVADPDPELPAQELMFGSPFTFSSVFSNTVFGDSAVDGAGEAVLAEESLGKKISPHREPCVVRNDPEMTGLHPDAESSVRVESGGEMMSTAAPEEKDAMVARDV
ncbi:hypothetical protein NHX12_017842 [Muraenolepis orangiensis]|uniref:PLD phosphodiesterase domain-containing protein n=1 Tax=Muraenolepis orangiensis TaxID=630683 RepID=A0A9Q0EZ27_9TELE|nr:hypothetical protein NHX12_017842 [Muraenolepis orangiensis]